jgi:hypothetical protein
VRKTLAARGGSRLVPGVDVAEDDQAVDDGLHRQLKVVERVGHCLPDDRRVRLGVGDELFDQERVALGSAVSATTVCS